MYNIYKHGDTLNLGEVEAAMIALNIVFQKIYLLPVSRWTGVKDRIVNVPILPETVNQNIQSLPRTPKDAQVLVPVKFKRKREYKNVHQEQFVDPDKIMEAVKIIKQSGNKFYEDVSVDDNFENYWKQNDPESHAFAMTKTLVNRQIMKCLCQSVRKQILLIQRKAVLIPKSCLMLTVMTS